jgi:murein DD-endopeptidase MepM/ murein hydrolase activator NlpD
MRPETGYAYRNNFLDPREGAPEPYNHGRVDRAGELIRLHDGIDIYAELGEPLIAPFSGTVIDPAIRWQPWIPDRYGRTVIIVSDEPQTAGYTALLSHLDRVWVEIGQHVARGQVVGTVGRTGNADEQSVHPHVHFELRAPFLLDWTQLGHDRVLDAFNPYQSLVAADPRRNR